METDIGIAKKDRETLAKALKAVLGETYALYGKTHAYHWNVTGPRFRSLHLMFEEQYRELWAALDEIAERIRALGVFAPVSGTDMASAATIPTDNDVPEAEAMLRNLAQGHEILAKACKRAVEAAEKAGDPVTADLMTVRAGVSEKTAWMLRASL